MAFSLTKLRVRHVQALFVFLTIVISVGEGVVKLESPKESCTIEWRVQTGSTPLSEAVLRNTDSWRDWTLEHHSILELNEGNEVLVTLHGVFTHGICDEASFPVPWPPSTVFVNGRPALFKHTNGGVVFQLPAGPIPPSLDVTLVLDKSTIRRLGYRQLEVTPSSSAQASESASASQPESITASVSRTRSFTKSRSLTRSLTKSATVSISDTSSTTSSVSYSVSVTSTATGSTSVTATVTQTHSTSASVSRTATISLTSSRSLSPSVTPTVSVTPSITLSRTRSRTPTYSISSSVSKSPTSTRSASMPLTATSSESATPSQSVSAPPSPSETSSVSASPSCSCGCSALSCCTNVTAEYEEQCRLTAVGGSTGKIAATPVTAPAVASAVGGVVLIAVGIVGFKFYKQRRRNNPVPATDAAVHNKNDENANLNPDNSPPLSPQTVSLDAATYDPDHDVTTVDVNAIVLTPETAETAEKRPEDDGVAPNHSKIPPDNRSLETLDTGSDDTPTSTASPKPERIAKSKKQRRAAAQLKTRAALVDPRLLTTGRTSPKPVPVYEDTTIMRGNSIDKVVGPAFLAELLASKTAVPPSQTQQKPKLKVSRLGARAPSSPTVRQLLRSFAEDSLGDPGAVESQEATVSPSWMRPQKPTTH